MEAMLCGCFVIGYHGNGGREYFKKEFSCPIESTDIFTFANKVEEVINQYKSKPSLLIEKGKQASEYIKQNYSLEKEEANILAFWKNFIF